MNEFGHIADDLTTLEMRVERMLGHAHAKSLKAALQRAFVAACKASREQRLASEGQTQLSVTPASSRMEAATPRSGSRKERSAIGRRAAEASA